MPENKRKEYRPSYLIIVAVALIFFAIFTEKSPLLTALGFALIFALMTIDQTLQEKRR